SLSSCKIRFHGCNLALGSIPQSIANKTECTTWAAKSYVSTSWGLWGDGSKKPLSWAPRYYGSTEANKSFSPGAALAPYSEPAGYDRQAAPLSEPWKQMLNTPS